MAIYRIAKQTSPGAISSKGIVAWLWGTPRIFHLVNKQTTKQTNEQPNKQQTHEPPHEPLKNICSFTKSKEVWVMALIPPLAILWTDDFLVRKAHLAAGHRVSLAQPYGQFSH